MTTSDKPITGELARVVEALVFAADEPVDPGRIAGVYAKVTGSDLPTAETIQETVQELNAKYAAQGHVLRIHVWAGGLRMATEDSVAPYLETFFSQEQPHRLSRALMETLAILSYRQPATKAEIDHIRGVNSDYSLRKLLELDLITIIGRGDTVGQPILYGTTPRFLEAFGLGDLGELPNLREVEALLDDPAFSEERARMLMLRGLDKEAPESDTNQTTVS